MEAVRFGIAAGDAVAEDAHAIGETTN